MTVQHGTEIEETGTYAACVKDLVAGFHGGEGLWDDDNDEDDGADTN